MVLTIKTFLYNRKTGSWCLSFPFKAWGLAALLIRPVLIINLTAFPQNYRVSLSLPALNPGALFSFLLINVLCTFFFFFFTFQNRVLSSPLKICSGREPFSSLIFLVAFGNLSAASWLAEASFSVILVFVKPNHPLLALNSPALEPSPCFCFKLSYNDFFSKLVVIYRYDFLIAIMHPHKSYIFSTR